MSKYHFSGHQVVIHPLFSTLALHLGVYRWYILKTIYLRIENVVDKIKKNIFYNIDMTKNSDLFYF